MDARGTAAKSLRDTAVALREVLSDVTAAQENSHLFIHNYERPLWKQVLEQLPHRHVTRAAIVSPFFEPNMVQPEDPATEVDVGIFERVLNDLTFEPPKREGRVDRVGWGRSDEGFIDVRFMLLKGTYEERIFHAVMQRDQWFQVLIGSKGNELGRADDDAYSYADKRC